METGREIIDDALFKFIAVAKGYKFAEDFDYSEFNTLLDEIQEQ